MDNTVQYSKKKKKENYKTAKVTKPIHMGMVQFFLQFSTQFEEKIFFCA